MQRIEVRMNIHRLYKIYFEIQPFLIKFDLNKI
jgi:hypothetical protein